MTEIVDSEKIEQLVGRERHPSQHWGRADTRDQTFYILHSTACLNSGVDLRECHFSVVLDRGIDWQEWVGHADRPTLLVIRHGRLAPR